MAVAGGRIIHVAEWITTVRVYSRRKHYKVGLEAPQEGRNQFIESINKRLVAAIGRHWQINFGSVRVATPHFVHFTRTREEVTPIFVKINCHYIGIVVEAVNY